MRKTGDTAKNLAKSAGKNLSKKLIVKIIAAIGGSGAFLIILIPLLAVIAAIVSVTAPMTAVRNQQSQFFTAIFRPETSIHSFQDGTVGGQQRHEFITFARIHLSQTEAALRNFLQENQDQNGTGTENIDMRSTGELSRQEIRNSPRLMIDDAVLRTQIVFYILYLHQYSPQRLPMESDEILNLLVNDENFWDELSRDWQLQNTENTDGEDGEGAEINENFVDSNQDSNDSNDDSNENNQEITPFVPPDYEKFILGFFELNLPGLGFDPYEPPNFDPFDYFDPSNGGLFLWEHSPDMPLDNESWAAYPSANRNQNGFKNDIIYAQISEIMEIEITDFHAQAIEYLWNYFHQDVFLNFTGAYSPPVEPQHLWSITSPFGSRIHPTTGRQDFHNGVDIAWGASTNQSNIYAVMGGRVIAPFEGNGGATLGNHIRILHDNGWETLYAHNYENLVLVGDIVEAGQRIGLIGNTGRSTGAHLHFGLRIGGEWATKQLQNFYNNL